MNLDKALETYLAHLETRMLSVAHTVTVKNRVQRLINCLGGNTAVTAVSGSHVAAYFDELEATGLAHATLAGHKSTTRAFWRWLLDNGHVAENPADAIMGKQYAYDYRPVRNRPVRRDDLQQAMNALPAFAAHRQYHPRDVRDAAMLAITADSAKRRGEIWNLRRRDVAQALAHGERLANGRIVYRASSRGKTGMVDVIFFDETAALLTRWLEIMPKMAVWLWVNVRTGRRLRQDAMVLGLRRIAEFTGVRPFGFHAVRKRRVTDAIAASGDWKVGQLYAGHSDGRTTQLHYNDAEQSRVELIASELSGSHPVGGDSLAVMLFGRKPGS